MIRFLAFVFVVVSVLQTNIAFGDQVTTTVTTYVTKTQEERQSTRWTLTEWLRIKERTKMMDVWLAMFSDPAKDKFRPELNLTWLTTRSNVTVQTADLSALSEGSGAGHTGRAQFWMTNLISTATGARTLNIDFGVEAGQHDTGSSMQSDLSSAALPTAARAVTTWYTGNFRLFGKSIQDSSLVLKYGVLKTTNSLQLPEAQYPNDDSNRAAASSANGTMLGGELQLYVFHWLGAEGTYHQYSPTQVAYSDHTLRGQYSEGLVFIEVSVLRAMFGRYEENWSAKWDDTATKSREWGYLAGLKVQI